MMMGIRGSATALLLGGLASAVALAADPASVTNVRMWPAPDHTRVVLDVDRPVEHSLFVLKNPERVVVDLRRTRLATSLARPARNDRLLRQIRAARRPGGDLRVVLDLRRAAQPRSFLLRPNARYGHRLVIDLRAREEAGKGRGEPVKRAAPPSGGELRDLVIAIDAGHGGEDPGAAGRGGTREKDVVLAIARRLYRRVRAEPGMRPVMVRSGDYYIGLRKRMEIARANRADMFVSIHADAFRDPRVTGTSVYILSRNGASSEAARWLAEQENAADLVGGVSLDDKDELLASVLLDLSQTATLSASADAGNRVLRALRRIGKAHKRRVERAGFVVLKSPDIPSILVETGFITNRAEERRLREARHQEALAGAILAGLRSYFRRNAPPGTRLAARNHVIARGETLSGIASRYRVPLARLRQVNALKGDRVRAGQVLRIPAPQDG